MLALSSRSSRRVTGSARAALWVIARLLRRWEAPPVRSNLRPSSRPRQVGRPRSKNPPRRFQSQRIPRQQALTTAAVDGVLREAISANETRPVAAAQLTLRHLQTGQIVRASSSVEGVFRILLLSPGHYEFRVEAEGYAPFVIPDLALNANEVTTLEISLIGISSARISLASSAPSRTRSRRRPWFIARAWQLSRTSPSSRFRSQLHRRARSGIPASGRGCLQRRAQSLGAQSAGLSPLSAERRIPLHQAALVRPFQSQSLQRR